MTLRSHAHHVDGQRHGSTESSGADSMHSTDTIRPSYGGGVSSGKGMPVSISTSSKRLLRSERKDSEISPSTVVPKSHPPNPRSDIAPWDEQAPPKDSFACSMKSNGSKKEMPWPNGYDEHANPIATSIFGGTFGTFYDDSSDNLGQISPGFAPSGGIGFADGGEDRRPSVASGTTISSTGSKSSMSGKYRKRLQGFFGDEYKGFQNENPSRQNSETSSVQGSFANLAPGPNSRNRNNSINDGVLPPSPASSRPRTPGQAATAEVAPWAFPDGQVCVQSSSLSSLL